MTRGDLDADLQSLRQDVLGYADVIEAWREVLVSDSNFVTDRLHIPVTGASDTATP